MSSNKRETIDHRWSSFSSTNVLWSKTNLRRVVFAEWYARRSAIAAQRCSAVLVRNTLRLLLWIEFYHTYAGQSRQYRSTIHLNFNGDVVRMKWLSARHFLYRQPIVVSIHQIQLKNSYRSPFQREARQALNGHSWQVSIERRTDSFE